jgi:hypothetical protein
MESAGPSRKPSHKPNNGWAEIIGTVIALLTLTLPLFVTAYYSGEVKKDSQPKTYLPHLEKKIDAGAKYV